MNRPPRFIHSAAMTGLLSLFAFATTPTTTHAAAVWGATEWTQIANNVELVTTAMQAIETATNTLETVNKLKETLRQLDPRNIKNILGNVSPEFQSVLKLYDTLQQTKSSYQDLTKMLSNSMAEAQAMAQSPMQYLQFRSKLATSKGGIYKANYDADIAKLDNAKKQAQDLDKLIDSIGSINSPVSGLQAVVSANARVISALQSMQETISRNSAQDSMDKQEDANAVAAIYANSQRKMAAKAPAVSLSMPKTSEVTATTPDSR